MDNFQNDTHRGGKLTLHVQAETIDARIVAWIIILCALQTATIVAMLVSTS